MSEYLDPWVTTSGINQDMINLLGNALHRDMCGTDVPCLGFYYGKYVEGRIIFTAHAADNPAYTMLFTSVQDDNRR